MQSSIITLPVKEVTEDDSHLLRRDTVQANSITNELSTGKYRLCLIEEGIFVKEEQKHNRNRTPLKVSALDT
jgi:hypothetical protein